MSQRIQWGIGLGLQAGWLDEFGLLALGIDDQAL